MVTVFSTFSRVDARMAEYAIKEFFAKVTVTGHAFPLLPKNLLSSWWRNNE